jgi:hypothetical protein
MVHSVVGFILFKSNQSLINDSTSPSTHSLSLPTDACDGEAISSAEMVSLFVPRGGFCSGPGFLLRRTFLVSFSGADHRYPTCGRRPEGYWFRAVRRSSCSRPRKDDPLMTLRGFFYRLVTVVTIAWLFIGSDESLSMSLFLGLLPVFTYEMFRSR